LISEKKLTAACIGTLALVAVLGLVSDRVQQGAIDENKGLAAVINESGRQRMLTQLISNLATQYWLGDASAKPELEAAMTMMAAGNKQLSEPYRAEGPADSGQRELHTLYFMGPGAVDTLVAKYLAEAEQVASAPAKNPAAEASLHDLQAQARGGLRDALNQIVLLHQREMETNMSTLKQLVWALYVLMVGVLVLVYFLAFQPMMKQAGRYGMVEDESEME